MSYRVEFSPEFGDNVRRQVEYLREQHVSEERIDGWFGDLFDQLDSLSTSPKRHPLDPIQSTAIAQPSRKMVYGDYLVFYRVDDDTKQVSIDRFVHGARDRKRELEQLLEQHNERTAGKNKDRSRDGGRGR